MRYVDLIENRTRKVSVSIKRYVGIEAEPTDASPFPANLTFKVLATAGRDATTMAIKTAIQNITGYEPGSFRWKWILPES